MNLESFKSVILYEIQGYRKENGTSDTATVLMFFLMMFFTFFRSLPLYTCTVGSGSVFTKTFDRFIKFIRFFQMKFFTFNYLSTFPTGNFGSFQVAGRV